MKNAGAGVLNVLVSLSVRPLVAAALGASLAGCARKAIVTRKTSDCPATLRGALGDVRIRRAGTANWTRVAPPARLCVDDRVFAGSDGNAHVQFEGLDESDVWVGAGSVFAVSREPPLSSRLAKVGHSEARAWVGSVQGGQGGDKTRPPPGVESALQTGLRLDVLVREHTFAFPRGGVRVVAESFPTMLIFQLTDEYLAGVQGGSSRGVLWFSGAKVSTSWSGAQDERTWRVPIRAPGRYVFQVFSEATRDRSVPAQIEVLDGKARLVSLLPESTAPGTMVVIP